MIVFGNCVLATMSFIFTVVPPLYFKLLHTYIIIFFSIFNLIIFIYVKNDNILILYNKRRNMKALHQNNKNAINKQRAHQK
ncbi:hypothetical protein BK772_18835 [Bacillus thuringiensis serovar finitimus]|uniref:Uncharacterized protein n=1 Tax=Bacillus thuringiensis subsp. finitimus TaxID=29337 RepID=A0A243GK68_BACTF|nr:hypothetical protein BK772_18835 [Bacillus thuringiensis serovar finitimus]